MNTLPRFSAFFTLVSFVVMGCARVEQTGQLQVQITDSPTFDEQIEAIYATISEVYVDEQPFEGWSGKRTINLLDLQNGNLESLGLASAEARQHARVRLVLDNLQDDQGNSPGCYVQTINQAKLPLSTSPTTEIITTNLWEVRPETTTSVVVDFDVQRAIVRYGDNEYGWASAEGLHNAVRAFNLYKTSPIEGKCEITNNLQNYKIVMYGYVYGTFNEEFETTPNFEGIAFRNALVSAQVDSLGNYIMPYVTEVDLDIRLAYYTENNGIWSFAGMLEGEGRNELGNVVPLKAFSVFPFNHYIVNINNLRPI